MYAAIVRLVGLGSIVACTIVIVAFALFAINETGTASTKQQQSLASGTALATPVQPANAGSSHKSPVRKAIEDELQAVVSGKKQPKEAVAAAQKTADEILRPYVEQTALRLPPSN